MPVLRLALAGDLVLTRDLRAEADAGVRGVAELLRGADCAIANLEAPLHDFSSPASAAAGGLWLGADPERARDFSWLGLTALSRANNHAGDYGPDAMRQTDRALEKEGIAHAGTGEDLDAARRPAFVDTPSGAVALVSCTSTFPLGSMAGRPRPPVPGRPGVSPLRRAGDRFVEPAEALARTGLSWPELWAAPRTPARERLARAEADESPVSGQDAAEVLASVRGARRHAAAVVVAIHAHDSGADEAEPALAAFARACIEAGADAVAMHGPHRVRGLGWHRGRPILHGLGSQAFQPDTVPFLPEDAYRLHGLPAGAGVEDLFAARWGDGSRSFAARPEAWRGLIALVRLEQGAATVDLVPVDLGRELGRGRRGTPRIAGEPGASFSPGRGEGPGPFRRSREE